MPALDSKLRSQLDDVCQKARDQAVAYAQSALQKRGVDAAEALTHFGPKDKELRNRLRARGRQVGDVRKADGTQSIDQLSQELAYEYWHRMLFARFLAENNLLMHPDGVAVSLEECDELAPEADPPAANGIVLAARYASTMLPQIFRTDDVLLEIEFAPEQRLALEKLLASLPKQTFEADDSLGWVYQFWQTAENERVNKRVKSGEKVNGQNLPAVTQFFTEHYMVEFLLHNTISAWWCAKEGIQGPPGGAGIPAGKSPVEMPYLRWRDDGTPAAGKFEGWPKTLAEFTMLDPCCGSGHFLVAAFNLLVPLRMHDEGLSATEACEAVLRDNLFGLELDPRCTQIAAFALALAAWKYPNAGGYRPLPALNIACSGQGIIGKKEEWIALANGTDRLREGMERLYDLFERASHLGSLIDPRREKGNMYEAGYPELQPLLVKALASKSDNADVSAAGVAAQGIMRAAQILGEQYTLIMTNVPYLGRGKQCDVLREYCEVAHAEAKADLSTCFVQRCIGMCHNSGSIALVTPQNWWFLSSYEACRQFMLNTHTIQLLATLGEEAWQSFGDRGPMAALIIASRAKAPTTQQVFAIDALPRKTIELKVAELIRGLPLLVGQQQLLDNPDSRLSFDSIDRAKLLANICESWQGLVTADNPRFMLMFWEVWGNGWEPYISSPTKTRLYGGRESVIAWMNGQGALHVTAKRTTFHPHLRWARRASCCHKLEALRRQSTPGRYLQMVAPLSFRPTSRCCLLYGASFLQPSIKTLSEVLTRKQW